MTTNPACYKQSEVSHFGMWARVDDLVLGYGAGGNSYHPKRSGRFWSAVASGRGCKHSRR